MHGMARKCRQFKMVVRGLIPVDGYTTCYYSPWENNVCSSYAGYDATWHAGVYDLDHT